MDVALLALGQPVQPFGDAPGQLEILGVPLRHNQAKLFDELELRLVDRPSRRTLLVGDHTWVTAALVRRFLDHCPPEGGQLAVSGSFLGFTESLQQLVDGRLPVAVVPDDGVAMADLPRVEVDLGVVEHRLPIDHPALVAANDRPLPVTDAMAHTIRHWTHVLRVNLLALLAHGEQRRRAFQDSAWWHKLGVLLAIAANAGSLRPSRWGAGAVEAGRGCKIHPTACVEAAVLGNEVEIGPFSVVRGSWLCDRVKVGAQARVEGTIAGAGSVLARGVNAHLCLLLPGAYISEGIGHQMSVFGRDAFVAAGVTLLDLSFGGEIRVTDGAQRVRAGTRFLGSCIGHRARIGANVRIGYGQAIPNDATVVADPADLLRGTVPVDAPVFVRDGVPERAGR